MQNKVKCISDALKEYYFHSENTPLKRAITETNTNIKCFTNSYINNAKLYYQFLRPKNSKYFNKLFLTTFCVLN